MIFIQFVIMACAQRLSIDGVKMPLFKRLFNSKKVIKNNENEKNELDLSAERGTKIQIRNKECIDETPLSSTKDIKSQIIEEGKSLVSETLNNHYKLIKSTQNEYCLPNDQVTSESFDGGKTYYTYDRYSKKYDEHTYKTDFVSSFIFNKYIPKQLCDELSSISKNLRQNFYGTAKLIEEENFRSVGDVVKKINFSTFEKNRTNTIFNSQKKVHISYQSIIIAVQFFQEINRKLLDEIENCKFTNVPQTETDLLLKNALLVYELSKSIITLLQNFQLDGKETILTIHKQILEEIEKNKSDDKILQERCGSDEDISEHIKTQTLKSIDNREKMRNIVITQWNKFLSQLDKIENNVNQIKRQINNMKLIRDNAKNQLGFLQIMTITQMIKDNLDAFQSLLEIDNIPLAPITPEDLCRLLGIENNRILIEENFK